MHRLVKPRRRKMSTLYTMVKPIGKKDIIVLNRNYTDEQLREKLSDPVDGYDNEWIDYILENGIRIPEGKKKVVRVWQDKSIIKTQFHPATHYAHWGEKVTIYPDGDFKINPGLLLIVIDWIREKYFSYSDSERKRKREK